MKMSQADTLKYIMYLINHPESEARKALFLELRKTEFNEAEFVNSVIEHGASFQLKPGQWFEFILRIPNRLYRHEKWLTDRLTPAQRKKLGFD